jgi:hypothetical protein
MFEKKERSFAKVLSRGGASFGAQDDVGPGVE